MTFDNIVFGEVAVQRVETAVTLNNGNHATSSHTLWSLIVVMLIILIGMAIVRHKMR